jgi:tRNA A-37 threonylcarbamoyl transferase component Bud32
MINVTDPLDIEQPAVLSAYLQHTGRLEAGEQPVVRVLAGGVSNRTVWVERPNGQAWVLKQALPKLRVAVDWFCSPARIQREGLGLLWLAQLAPPGATCPLVFEDYRHHLLAMQAVPQPHHNWKSLLLAGQLQSNHIAQFGRLLGTIHRRAYERQDEVAPVFADRSFFEELRLEPYYAYSATQIPEAAVFLHQLIEATRACPLTLVHGDYSPKNILIYQDRLVLLDHEVIHWGDPAFDIGFSLTHLLSKAHHLLAQRQALAEAAQQYWQTYIQTVGNIFNAQPSIRPAHAQGYSGCIDGLETRAVRHTLACLLARVAGRSPLEYLDQPARSRQRQAVLALLPAPSTTIPALVEQFIAKL